MADSTKNSGPITPMVMYARDEPLYIYIPYVSRVNDLE